MDKLKPTPRSQESQEQIRTPEPVSPELPEDSLDTVVGGLATRAVTLHEAVSRRRTVVVDGKGNVVASGSLSHRAMLDRDPDHAQ